MDITDFIEMRHKKKASLFFFIVINYLNEWLNRYIYMQIIKRA